MSHFYASIPTSARRTTPTACGHKTGGITTRAASWAGAVEVRVWYDATAEGDRFEVRQTLHHGAGVREVIASGIVGERVQA